MTNIPNRFAKSHKNNVIPFPGKTIQADITQPKEDSIKPGKTSMDKIAILLLLALGLIWGSGYAIARFATLNAVPPLGYAFWQSLGPAIITCLFAIKEKQKLPSLKHWRYYIVCGLVGLTIPNTAMYFAAPHVPAGSLAVIVNTVPIFIFPLALIFGQEVFSWKRFGAVACGIIGILLLIVPRTGLIQAGQINAWYLLAILSPVCFALCAIYIAQQQKQPNSPLTAAAGMLIASSIFLAPITAASHSFYPLLPPFNSAEWVVILEILLSSVGYVLFFHLLRRAGSVYYSMVGGVVGVTGLFWGWLIFNEKPTLLMWVAVICIIGAVTALSLFKVIKPGTTR